MKNINNDECQYSNTLESINDNNKNIYNLNENKKTNNKEDFSEDKNNYQQKGTSYPPIYFLKCNDHDKTTP